jgi:hypothetical protein
MSTDILASIPFLIISVQVYSFRGQGACQAPYSLVGGLYIELLYLIAAVECGHTEAAATPALSADTLQDKGLTIQGEGCTPGALPEEKILNGVLRPRLDTDRSHCKALSCVTPGMLYL